MLFDLTLRRKARNRYIQQLNTKTTLKMISLNKVRALNLLCCNQTTVPVTFLQLKPIFSLVLHLITYQFLPVLVPLHVQI